MPTKVAAVQCSVCFLKYRISTVYGSCDPCPRCGSFIRKMTLPVEKKQNEAETRFEALKRLIKERAKIDAEIAKIVEEL